MKILQGNCLNQDDFKVVIDFKNAPFGLKIYAVTIGFAFQKQIVEISVKRIRATSACEQQGGKLTLQLGWLAGKELVTVPRY